MQSALHPLLFTPLYRDYLWGGGRIARRFGRSDAPACCAESWELAARPDGDSLVADGPLKGRALSTLCQEYGPRLIGTAAPDGGFPLLVKLIDARERLSVQVHPDDKAARRYGGEAKTEMWHVLEAAPEACLFLGFRERVGPRRLHDALEARTAARLLRTVPSVVGRSIYVPGGTVHAIGEGNLLLEIQQNSDTTYRLYDWDRLGPDGKTRPLQVPRAMEVIDWRAPILDFLAPIPMSASGAANRRARLLRSDYFTLFSLDLQATENVPLDGATFHALFAFEGDVTLGWDADGGVLTLPQGRTCLVPAGLHGYALTPAGASGARLLTITL